MIFDFFKQKILHFFIVVYWESMNRAITEARSKALNIQPSFSSFQSNFSFSVKASKAWPSAALFQGWIPCFQANNQPSHLPNKISKYEFCKKHQVFIKIWFNYFLELRIISSQVSIWYGVAHEIYIDHKFQWLQEGLSFEFLA